MKSIALSFLFLCCLTNSFGQSDSLTSETLGSKPSFLAPATQLSKPRFWGTTSGLVAGYAGVSTVLWQWWYADYPHQSLHFINDFGGWNDVDKMGHAITAWGEANYSAQLYRWSGVSRRRAAWLGTGVSIMGQFTLEAMDGFSAEWGASWGDLIFNTAGSGLFLGQELAWNEQRITMKYSWHSQQSNYKTPAEKERAADLFGGSLPQNMLKDYNGTTIWLSGNISAFMKPETRFPKWLNVAVGYGAQGLMGAERNTWIDKQNLPQSSAMPRYTQIYLAPDIDLTRLPFKFAKKRGWKLLFSALNIFKFPLPALEFNTLGQFKVHPIYF